LHTQQSKLYPVIVIALIKWIYSPIR